MQLHEVKRNKANKRPKTRVGRGGKRGTTAGRGTKGQKAHAGGRIRPADRDFIQRLPKLRGHKNRKKSVKPPVLNVGDLEKNFEDSTVINKKTFGKVVKILSRGEVKKTFTVEGLAVSKKAKEKIESAGGKVV